MKRYTYYLLIVLSMLMAGCAATNAPTDRTAKAGEWLPVTGYIDGDTFRVQSGDNSETIRLLYVDTPEITGGEDHVPEPFGEEASDYSKERLEQSKEVRLTFDKEHKDRFGRTLAVVELRDGTILNELLLQEGLAKVLIVEPNVKMENVYKGLEQQAKHDMIGIWSTGEATNQTDVPVKKAAQIGIELKVDKRDELVTINNTTNEYINLDGWKLVSVRGNQTYTFDSVQIPAKGMLRLSSSDKTSRPSGDSVLIWEVDNVWNNNEPDPGELYNENNELVAVWEDQ
ncbi:MAG: micrococcal nuclease-like nuclease [Paenibacillus sp.]|nr:micrococcal nuclease-like nuclease [Paenibacillus sp.]